MMIIRTRLLGLLLRPWSVRLKKLERKPILTGRYDESRFLDGISNLAVRNATAIYTSLWLPRHTTYNKCTVNKHAFE